MGCVATELGWVSICSLFSVLFPWGVVCVGSLGLSSGVCGASALCVLFPSFVSSVLSSDLVCVCVRVCVRTSFGLKAIQRFPARPRLETQKGSLGEGWFNALSL